MKPSRSRGSQQQQQEHCIPLFPRVHVSETRNGPKAPPRNKMALYEQLTIPAHHHPSLQLPPIWPHQRNLDEIPSSSTTNNNSRVKDSSQKRGRKEEAQKSNAFNAGKLVPAKVIAALGEFDFWRIRKAITRQQRIFDGHVFELHRLIQVQEMLAESPVLRLQPQSTVPRLQPQSTSPKKTSSKTLVSKPVNVHSTATKSSNQNQQQQNCGPTHSSIGLPVSSSSLYPGVLPSSWRYAATSGGNQWICPYMVQGPIPVGTAPSYQPGFGSHFVPGLQFYYHQNQQHQQQQQWLGGFAPNPWYASYPPQLQLSTSANSMAASSPNGCADVHFQQQQQQPQEKLQQQQQQQQEPQQQQQVKESGFGSTSGLTSDRTSSKEQQQQDPRTSLRSGVEDSRTRISAFSHVTPTERTTNQGARTQLAPRAVMVTPESAAGILKSIQREKHSSQTF